MRLNEFSSTPLLFKDVLAAIQRFRPERVGGTARVYSVGQELGVAYIINGGPQAIGLTWTRGSTIVNKVYYWNVFNTSHSPDLVIDLPQEATMSDMPAILDFIQNPHAGLVESLSEDAVPVPANDEAEPAAPVPAPVEQEPIRHVQIMARNASGEMFVVPGTEKMAAAIEARLNAQQGAEENLTMEEQYAQLRDKVELVAGNKSHHIKSLLIYGAPSSGKTFTVMQVVKALGLKEGVDYVVKKGSISDFAAYRTLIANIDGLVIFDDCDSVVATKVGKNMIKGALDTYPVRDLSYDNQATIDTDSMPTEDRVEFVDAMSRVMKGTATAADLEKFDRYAVSDKAKKKDAPKGKSDDVFRNADGQFELPDIDDLLANYSDDDTPNSERMHELQDYFSRRLPNKIDYRGRMIFISNMGEDEWDSAILTRTFRQYMSFGDEEMLNFIERIQSTIAAPSLSAEQKQEVIDYIRSLHERGSLHSPINFRLIQQGFDLRLTSGWKKALASL